MSDKITYVLEVLDKYSLNTKKFKSELLGVKRAAEEVDRILSKGFASINALPKAVRETNALASSIDKVTRANQRNATVAINTTRSLGNMRKTLAGAYTPIRFNPELGKYEARTQPTPLSPARTGGGGMGVSFGGVAKAMGYYSLIDKAVGIPREIFNTRREFDSLGATLEAIMPKYDRTVSAQAAAAREMDYLKTTAYNLGMNLGVAKEEYVKFLAASAGKSTLKEVHDQFEAFSKLSAVYQITPYRFGLVMNAITQMTSKGVVSMEELRRQLGDSLPGAVSIFAKAAMKARPDLVKTEADFIKLVETGRVGSGLLREVGKVIVEDTDLMSGLDKALDSLNSRTNKLSTSWTNLLDRVSKGKIGEGLSNSISKLDEAIQNLDKHLNSLAELWNSKPVQAILGAVGWTYEKARTGAEIAGAGIAAGYYDIARGGNEGRQTFNEALQRGEFGTGQYSYGAMNIPRINQMTSIPSEQKIVLEFVNAPQNMMPLRVPQNMSVRKDGTLSPAGGSY